MRNLRIRRPSTGTMLGGLALVVAMSGVAVAAIPGSDGTVTACVSKDGGIKVIDAEAGKTCQGSQTTAKLATTDAAGKVRNATRLSGLTKENLLAFFEPRITDAFDSTSGEFVFEGAGLKPGSFFDVLAGHPNGSEETYGTVVVGPDGTATLRHSPRACNLETSGDFVYRAVGTGYFGPVQSASRTCPGS